jgi:hypothetical protein
MKVSVNRWPLALGQSHRQPEVGHPHMFNFERIRNAPWGDLQRFLLAGDPPIITRLLIVNALFLALFVYSKLRGGTRMRKSTAICAQLLLITINFAVMFQSQSLDFIWKLKGAFT